VALFGGLFYIFARGRDARVRHRYRRGHGVRQLGLPVRDLGQLYVSSAIGGLVTLGTAISAIGCCLATRWPRAAAVRDEPGRLRGPWLVKVSSAACPVAATVFVTCFAPG